MNELII